MKTLLTLVTAIAFAAACLSTGFAEEKEMMKKDHIMMKDGKMMVMKDGKGMMMEKEMMLDNGSKVMTNGTVMTKGGDKMMMKDGDMMMMDGKMMKAEAAKDAGKK